MSSTRSASPGRSARPSPSPPRRCIAARPVSAIAGRAEYGDKDRGGISLGTALAISGAAASPEHGLSLLADRGAAAGAVQRAARLVARQSGAERRSRLLQVGRAQDRDPAIHRRDVRPDHGRPPLRLSVRRRALREPRPLRDDPPPLPLHRHQRCGLRSGLRLRGSRQRGAQDRDRSRRIHHLRKLHELKKRSADGAVITGAYYAIGEIDYKTAPEWNSDAVPGGAEAENGYILYIKPGYHGNESAGIVAYATANATFPHETTADQFFSESQFESYRTLGFEIADGVLKEAAKNVGKIRTAQDLDAGSLRGPPVRPHSRTRGESAEGGRVCAQAAANEACQVRRRSR